MFPVNSILDNALTDIRSKIEEQVYSTLAAHLKDYEGGAEDFTDRYGEIKESEMVPSIFGADDIQLKRCKKALSLFPQRPDVWIIHFGYKRNQQSSYHGEDNSSTEVILIDNYGMTYKLAIYSSNELQVGYSLKVLSSSEYLMLARLNNKLIDYIKKGLPIYNGTRQHHRQNGYNYTIINPTGTTENGIAPYTVELLCTQIREIAKYHQRLYGIINGLKKEVATLKSKIPETAPNPFD
jgi:hypothetical protein